MGKIRTCLAILFNFFIGISQIFIAVTLTGLLMHSLDTSFMDIHIFLCSFGFHFFSVQAMLIMVVVDCSEKERIRTRSFAHGILQVCALICIITGTFMVAVDKGLDETHGILGMIATSVAVLASVLGPVTMFLGSKYRIIHLLLGLTAFVTSTASLVTGLQKPVLVKWLGNTLNSWFLIFPCLYTFVIVIMCLDKSVRRICDRCDDGH